MIVPEGGTGPTGVRTLVTGPGTPIPTNTYETVSNQITLNADGSTSTIPVS